MTKTGFITCARYAGTNKATSSCKHMSKTYNKSCFLIPVYGSDGNRYCTPCHLHVYSCKTRFQVYGPVSGSDSAPRPEVDESEDLVVRGDENGAIRVPSPSGAEKCVEDREEVDVVDSANCMFHDVLHTERCLYDLLHGKISHILRKVLHHCRIEDAVLLLLYNGCRRIGPTGSDGKAYCSLCQLRAVSCKFSYQNL